MDDTLLKSYLERIRDIARLREEEALAEPAKLIRELADYDPAVPFEVQAYDMELARAQEELNNVRRDVTTVQEALARGVPIDYWRYGDLGRRADDLGRYWSPAIRGRLAGDVTEVSGLATSARDRLELDHWRRVVEACLSEAFSSSQASARALRDLREAEAFVASRNLEEDWLPRIREAKDRVARYRAGKKLAEAEVAEAGGNHKKAQRLRAEAAVVLKQDWVEVFPGEPFPENRR